jgi:phenylpropionate dioxygenase-like ring-hydroxylating dioxygenase large terminal subunit
MSRYPFPIPYGWFQVAWGDELAVGDAKAAFYFDRHLVIWRDDSGEAHVQDAFCPHLGAHLGHGGVVEGCEIRCPFHGWKFNAEGANTDIPYAERTNQKGRLVTYPVVERNGAILAWYHPQGADPMWEVPQFPEFQGDADFAPITQRTFTIDAAWQELAENGVDSAHFRYVHNTAEVPELEKYETEGYRATMRSLQKFPTPRGVVEGRIDVDTYGPGLTVTHFSGIVDTFLMGCNTPISAEKCELRFSFTVKSLGDEKVTNGVGQAFVNEVSRQVQEDKPVWEHKAYMVRPALASTDGPFMKYRKWASQFYVGEVDHGEQLVFPPPLWEDRMDDAPAKATASARLGD